KEIITKLIELDEEYAKKREEMFASLENSIIGYTSGFQFFEPYEIEEATGESVTIVDNNNNSDYPYKAFVEIEGIEFFCILDDEEYEEYKKATAPTVTQENTDTL